MEEKDEWMTITDAADWSGYYHDHLRVLIRKGKISAIKKEGRWQVSRQSLLAYKQAAEEQGDKRWGQRTSRLTSF